MHHLSLVIVPTPSVSVTSLTDQIAGLPLELQCIVTGVRGITSTVNITWIVDDLELEPITVVVSSLMDIMQLYTHTYTIDQLNVTNNETVYQCKVVIDSDQLVNASDIFRLNVTGKQRTVWLTINRFMYICVSLSTLVLNSGRDWHGKNGNRIFSGLKHTLR